MSATRRIVAWTPGQPTPGTRDLGRWLEATAKVVVSRTVTDAPWENSRTRATSRRERAAAPIVRSGPGGDRLVP